MKKVLIRKGILKRTKVIGEIIKYKEAEIEGFGHQDSDEYTIKLENGEIIKIEYPNPFGKYNIIKFLD